MRNRQIGVGMLAAAAVLGLSASTVCADAIWTGPSNSRGDGDWGTGSNWSGGTGIGGVPASTDATWIQGISQASPADAVTANITIGDGTNAYTASTASLIARYGKTATLTINNNATLNVTGLIDSGAYNDAAASHLTVQGATGATVTANITRIYLERALTNPNTLTFSNVTVNLSSDANTQYTNVGGGNALILTGGATVNGTAYYVRNPNGSNISRMTIDNGTLTGTSLIYDYQLVQLGAQGHISLTGSGQDLYVYSGGRFEGEGSGLASNVSLRVAGGGTLAVGLTDPNTHTRASAATLTLSPATELDAGSTVVFGIFGHASNDQLNFTSGSSLASTGAILNLQTFNGYTPTPGDTFTLLTGTVPNYAWNTSQVDTNIWDLSKFNQAGGWKVSVVPEPASLALLGLGGVMLIRRRRR